MLGLFQHLAAFGLGFIEGFLLVFTRFFAGQLDNRIGLVMGGLVLLMLWSILHFPQIKTLETPMPRLAPMFILGICLVTIILLGLTIFLVEFI